MAATPAATGKLRSRYVSLEVAAVTGTRTPHTQGSARGCLFSRAWPDDALSAATAKDTSLKDVTPPDDPDYEHVWLPKCADEAIRRRTTARPEPSLIAARGGFDKQTYVAD